jgi:nucleotide-binding universal stress UspA family protein
MIQLRNIVVPIDFSEYAEFALQFGRTLAKSTGARLHLLNVVEPFVRQTGQRVEEEVRIAEQALQHRSNQLREEAIATQGYVMVGRADEQIGMYLQNHDSDMVIMGTHGAKGVEKVLFGSVTETILKSASCAVLAVNITSARSASSSLRSLLVPTDFSSYADYATEYAQVLAEALKANVHLLYVNEPASVLSGGYEVGFVAAEVSDAEEEARVRAQAQQRLQAIAERFSAANLVTHVALVNGRADEEIVKYADANAIDAIIMGTHGRRGLSKLLLGSVTERVYKTSACPVMAVRLPQQD